MLQQTFHCILSPLPQYDEYYWQVSMQLVGSTGRCVLTLVLQMRTRWLLHMQEPSGALRP
jgi:hypothetical protein